MMSIITMYRTGNKKILVIIIVEVVFMTFCEGKGNSVTLYMMYVTTYETILNK